MKTLKKLFISSIISVIAITGFSGISANAYPSDGSYPVYNVKVDNDALAGEGGMSRTGFNNYFSNASCYNGDARYTPSTNTSNTYTWIFRNSYSKYGKGNQLYATVSVYLNSYLFTDPKAKYELSCTAGSFYGVIVGTKDQNRAPAGWSYFSNTTTALPSLPVNSTTYVSGTYSLTVTPSGTAGKNTGVDAINYTITG